MTIPMTMTDQPADARRAWAAHYAAVKARIAAGRTPSPDAVAAKPAKPVVIVRPVINRPPPPKTPARAPGEPPPPIPWTRAELDALPRAKPRPYQTREKRALRKRERERQRDAHVTAVAALSKRFADLLERHGVTWRELTGASQAKGLIRPRLEVYRALFADGWSASAIGKACRRDHTSILYYIRKWGQHD